MPEKRKKYDAEFREGAVRIVEETRKPIAQVARDLGVNEGTLGNWVNQARAAREGRGELAKDDKLSALKINVDTSNGRVMLSGKAPDAESRERATRLAANVKGVMQVDNRLEIGG